MTRLLAPALLLVGCGDPAPTAPAAAPGPRFQLEITPPPPPLDGLSQPIDAVVPCALIPPGAVVEATSSFSTRLRARILVSRPGTAGFMALSSTDPAITVSPDARIREVNGALTGRGEITIVGSSATTLIDLSTATGTLTAPLPGGGHVAMVTAEMSYADGSPIVLACPEGGFIWFRYAMFRYVY